MSERVTMPALGESVTEGTVTRWLKSVGDEVEVDEPLLEVSTDKVDTEIPSPAAGTLQEILAEEDDTVEVGGDLCVIGDGDGAGESGAGQEQETGEPEETEGAEEQDTGEPQEAEPSRQTNRAADETRGQQDQPPGGTSTEAEQAATPQPDAGGGQGRGGGETVTMPALGESVTEGTITRWLKAEGDQVEVDEPLLEVSTDKVDTEIPSPVAGTLTTILAGEDQTVEVGAELAIVGGEAGGAAPEERESGQQAEPPAEDPAPEPEPEPAESEEQGRPEEPTAAEEPTEQPKAEAASSGGDASVYVTPLVRKLAQQHGVDLASVEGTGVGGRIRKQDVLSAAKQAEEPAPAAEQAPAPQEPAAAGPARGQRAEALEALQAKRGSTEKMSRLRRTIATRMVESLQVSAQLTTVVEVDVTKVARLRDRAKKDFQTREGVKLSFLPFFALATVEALKHHPNVNASVERDEIIYHSQENLGVAVDTDKGLLVPVIKDAGDLNIAGLARKIDDLAERTRTSKIGPDELGGGTFTLTNTGSRGALFDTPIINQPNVGILGTGTVVKRPVVVTDEEHGETIAIRSMLYLALTYDHRVVDGADAARFLGTIKERLEEASFEP